MNKYSVLVGAKGFETSVMERSRINASISNLKTATIYIKKWIGYYKKEPTGDIVAGIDFALSWSIKYKNEFYSVEHLVDMYSELWLDKYREAKLLFEKVERDGDNIIKSFKK